jgi:hypothetical protein
MTDDEFLAAFEECRLPKHLWTHQAHVRMAWLYLREKPLEEVIPTVRRGIQRYNASLGNREGYHETITVAYLVLIDSRLARGAGEGSFADFREVNADLLDRTLSTILVHYSREVLFSIEARQAFVEPDLVPLPVLTVRPGG